MATALILCRFVHFSVVLVLFGLCLSRDVIFRSSLVSARLAVLDRQLRCAMLWLATVALASAVVWLSLSAASMAGSWIDAIDPQTLLLVLGNTFFGKVWGWHLGIGVLMIAVLARSTAAFPGPRLIVSALLLATLAPVGHGAMFSGLFGQLLILNQMLHLSAVAAWLGALCWLLALVLRPEKLDMRALLLRFSGIGYGLVALIIATGLINVRVLSGAPWPIPAFSGFGLILAIKVGLVLCMVSLAVLNRMMLAGKEVRLQRLRISIALECAFGFAAVAAVSLLGTLPPMLAA
ncbi:copper homeostasis membrane protein CopD [Pseudomonas sp. DSP3-2-2]|uniref:copper homeostasis membrane protein CopD n=1 Tax=unclassified Pseudomonas TaxID=196821 RepID=UPI003CE74402